MRTAKTLIRLGGCPDWSESSLGERAILFVLSWGGLIMSKHIVSGFSLGLQAEISSLLLIHAYVIKTMNPI